MAKKSFNLSPVPLTAFDAFNSMLGGGNEGERIHLISIDELIEYPNQPFKPHSEQKLQELSDDIARNGVLYPLLIRSFENSYQILAGRNRKNAAVMAGLEKVPCIIKKVTDAEAKLILVNTNLNQRDEITPSERAFAYTMQAEALEESGAHNVRTTSSLAEKSNDSKRTIQYYMRLVLLNPALLELVDSQDIPVRAGEKISYIPHEQQIVLVDFLDKNYIQKISINQAEQLKQKENLEEMFLNEVFGLANSIKKPVKRNWKKSTKVLEGVFKSMDMSDDEIAEIIAKALSAYFNSQ